MGNDQLDVRVLGPLSVVRDGIELALGGRRQRLVLALLACDAPRVVGADRLVDEIWGMATPATGTGPLRTYIWQLRRLLGPARAAVRAEGSARVAAGAEGSAGERTLLVSRDAGYLLAVDDEQIDAFRFEQHVMSARAAAASGAADKALAEVEQGLALWRGPAFGDLATERALQAEARRLDHRFLEAQELRAELLLDLGEHQRVTAELRGLASAHPEREWLWAMLMTALYRSGRQGEALRCYGEVRARLIETMGIEPGSELRDVEQAILRQDPALLGPRPSSARFGAPPDLLEPSPAPSRFTVDTCRHNLPCRLTSLVGRQTERESVAQLLDESRLVTLSGSAGCGKTRLALTVAEDVLARFPGGAWFVDLAPIDGPAGAGTRTSAVARALGTPIGVEADGPDAVGERIGGERLLLVLDNAEHLVDAVAEVAEQLLERCPALHLLVTSREELRLGAEVVWRLTGLRLPADDAPLSLASMLESEAVQLFVERGRSVMAGFAPSDAALAAVVTICRQLDGIPLAIEQAASLVGALPVAVIAERLDDPFRLLTGAWRQEIPRHRTLRAALDWSLDLLDEHARTLFAQLGVFAGDFTLAAAEAVAAPGTDSLAVARGLSRLVRSSMVDGVSSPDGTDRYRMLGTTRAYAQGLLAGQADAGDARRRHAGYYAELAAEAERHLHGPQASRWLARLASELPNLRSAIRWAFAQQHVELGVRLVGSLRWFLGHLAALDEVAGWLDAGLRRRDDLPVGLQLKLLSAANIVAFQRGEISRTDYLGEETIALARCLGDRRELAMALRIRGAAGVYEGDLTRAEDCFEEAQRLCAQLGDRMGTAFLLLAWATASRLAGRQAHAQDQLRQALDLFRELHERHGQVWSLVHLALDAQDDGRVDDAWVAAEDAAHMAHRLGSHQLQHVTSCVLGCVELLAGNEDRAWSLLVRSIRDHRGSHTHVMVAIALEGLAQLAELGGDPADALALFGFARQLRRRWRITPAPIRARQLDEWLGRVTSVTGPERAAQELDRGRDLELDDVIALAETIAARAAGPVMAPALH